MPNALRIPVTTVVSEHVSEAAALRTTRNYLVSAPRIKLFDLGRLDDRVAAHLDGIAIAGDFGSQLIAPLLKSPSAGDIFVAAVHGVADKDPTILERLLSLAEAMPMVRGGLISAFGWVSAHTLKGTAIALLGHAEPLRKSVGIAACALHRVDPGDALNAAIASPDAPLRARALRSSAEIGRRDRLSACLEHLKNKDPACAFWAAWSGALLGDRGLAIESLRQQCVSPSPHRQRALQLVFKTLNNETAHALLKHLAQEAVNRRILIQGVGIAGDPHYVPWLIKQMGDLKVTRLAGESFSSITGVDLTYPDLERKPPEGVVFGPTENPEDEDVAMDPDDGLPWPDPVKIQNWWDANKHRFQTGERYFMGEPVNVENCKRVLRDGYQRQRIAAALYLSLLQPGTPLFPTSAPAWRQLRWLAKMG